MSGVAKLFVNKICPFAHRAMIVAAHKKYAAEQVEVSLADMPEWYKDINPREEVPAIQLPNGVCLSESMLIAQYIDGVTEPKNALFPDNAEIRNKIRDFNSAVESAQWASYAALMHKGSDDEFEGKINSVRTAFAKVQNLMSKESNFAIGSSFSLADVAFAPFVIRFSYTLLAYCNFDLVKEFPRVAAFRDQCLSVPAVASTTPPAEFFISSYKGYAGTKTNQWNYHLYRAAGCPFCERVELAIAAVTKGANVPEYLKDTTYFTSESIDLGNMPAIYKKYVNPDEEVPVLKLPSGKLVSSSLNAVTFLAENFTESGLVPPTEEQIFTGRWFVDSFSRAQSELGKFLRDRQAAFEIDDDVAAELKRANAAYASAGPAGKTYFYGETVSLYDCLVLPFVHRFEILAGSEKLQPLIPDLLKALAALRADANLNHVLENKESILGH